MRRNLGILGLLIGLGAVLVFWLMPTEAGQTRTASNISAGEIAFVISGLSWLLLSMSSKVAMTLGIKNKLINYGSLIAFICFVGIVSSLPPKNSGAEFHILHNIFGFAMIFGWSLIDGIDLTMTHLLKKW